MVLTREQIVELVKAPSNPVLGVSSELQADHSVHVTGENYSDKLSQIIGYENVEQFKQKKLLTKPFTRPLVKYIIDAQSRWKTAQGTTKFYKFKGTKQAETALSFKNDILSQVWKGGSMEVFINSFLSNALYTDFNGFLIVDKGAVTNEDGIKYETREGKKTEVPQNYEPKPYIIYKHVTDVHNFSVTGEKIDWLIYKVGKDKTGETFRVLDSKYDYLVKKTDTGEVEVVGEVLEHKAGNTPVVPVSTINKDLKSDYVRTSPIDALIPALDYYLNQYAEHVVSCLLHAHPIYYQVGQKCRHSTVNGACNDGQISWEDKGEAKTVECPACKGTGHNIHKDASTVIILPALTQQGEAFNMSNVAGYVSPPVDILKHQMEELDALKREILEGATGQIGAQNLKESTATEVVLNLKPLEDIISSIIDVIEKIEVQLTDLIGKMYYGDNYIGSEIIYGRRLNLRDENAVMAEIKQARETGASYVYLKSLFEELVYSKFAKNPYDLKRNLMLVNLEPFVGFSFDEVETSKNITPESKFIKQNFVDLLSTYETEKGDIVETSASLTEIRTFLEAKAAEGLTKLKEDGTSVQN
jgi:hypothetical protein